MIITKHATYAERKDCERTPGAGKQTGLPGMRVQTVLDTYYVDEHGRTYTFWNGLGEQESTELRV
jgi:hypothetical protein